MRNALFCSLLLLASTSACSESETPDSSANETSANQAAPAANATQTASADWRQMAECSSRMSAMARMWGAVSTTKSGEEASRFLQMEVDRQAAANRLSSEARRLEMEAAPAGTLFDPEQGEVTRIMRETDAAIEQERARQPFEEFATWLGREADRCAPLVPA